MATYKTEGIILKKKRIRESDDLITVFSKHYGKIKAIAKGTHRLTSRKAGSLELLNYCRLLLAQGRNLDLITEVELIKSYQPLKEDLSLSLFAFQVLELIDKLTVEEPHKKIFELLLHVLDLMSNWQKAEIKRITLLVTAFNIKLLQELGFWHEEEVQRLYGLEIDNLKRLERLRKISLAEINRLETDKKVAEMIKDIVDSYTSFILESQVQTPALIKKVSGH